MDNWKDTIQENLDNGDQLLPLESFFSDLKANGFSVTTLQIIHANKIIMQYANWVNNENTLCMYLAPVFAGSEDEQLLFKKLFDKHFTEAQQTTPEEKKINPSLEKKLRQHWKQFLALYIFLALIVVLVIIKTLVHTTNFDVSKIEVFVKEKNESPLDTTTRNSFQVKTNNKLELVTLCVYKTSVLLETEVLYDWGDSSSVDPLPSHIYTKPGKYQLTAYVNVLYKHNSIKKDTLHRFINVCSSGNELSLKLPPRMDSIVIGQTVKLQAMVTGKEKPIDIKWLLDGKEVVYGEKVSFNFIKAETHAIICRVIFDSINSPCTLEKYITLSIHHKTDFSKIVLPIDSLVNKTGGYNEYDKNRIPFLAALYKTLAAVFLLVAAFFIFLWWKELKKTGRIKSRILDKYKKLTSSFSSTKKPGILPFKNRNYLPVQQTELDHITKLLRRRVQDTVTFMHVQKTINRAIERNGFFEPVNAARLRQSEYLVLIDETEPDSQQVKLFEYLVVLLRKHNVLVEKFYYKKQPGFCYNIHEPNGISLEKIYAKHQRHVLLIFGNGYQLINPNNNEVEEKLAATLHHWQHKAIVTPVSFIDWQQDEKNILLPLMPIVPVDMEGLILLAEILSEKENTFDIIHRMNSNKAVFYPVKEIDFDDMEALEQYCNVAGWTVITADGDKLNILFEWVAALAIYPKIRWEMILAIGNAILDKYNLHRQLDFTILLRIVRISWMKNGFIKDDLRFQLLKKLSLENEKLARETILLLLKEIPQQEIESGGHNEEKEVQQIVNEFSLYANDPVYYSSYIESTYLFEKLWHNKLLKDDTATMYLKNEHKNWKTLINQYDQTGGNPHHIGVDEYLQTKEQEETLLSKVYLAFSIISVAVLVTSVAALRVLYIWDKVL